MGTPCILKVRFMPHYFYERPVLVPIFVRERNLKRIFASMKKGKKQNYNCIQYLFRNE